MLHLSRDLPALILSCCLLAPTVGGQEAPVFRADSRLVVLHTTVVDRGDKLVTDLPQKAFKVYENEIEQRIKLFKKEDVPVSLGLVIDNSGSMVKKRQTVEAAALQLVKASNPEDEVFVINFDTDVFLDCPFTNSIARLEECAARIDAHSETAMRDAISVSIDYMKEDGKRDKKVLLVITDGNDNASTVTLERLVQKAQQAEVLVYAIGLLNEEDRGEARSAKRALDAITRASGGLPYYPEELAEVNDLALRVAHEIRNQYTIAYTPSDPALDGSYRQIRVSVDGPNKPVARTRTGYYATPEPREKPAALKPSAGP